MDRAGLGTRCVYGEEANDTREVAYLDEPSSYRPLAKPADLIPFGKKVHFPNLFSYIFIGMDQIGNYQLFSALSQTAAFADGRIDEGDIIALDIDTVTFSGDSCCE